MTSFIIYSFFGIKKRIIIVIIDVIVGFES